MKTANQIIQDLVDAWESLPGGRRQSAQAVEQWLADDMKPVLDEARAFLKRIDPEVPLRQRVLNVLAIRDMRGMGELAECLDIPDKGLQRRLLDDVVWEFIQQGLVKCTADSKIVLVKK